MELETATNDPKIVRLLHDISILKSNKIPLDTKGNEPDTLIFQIDNPTHLNTLLDALETNTTFKGNLTINSYKFTDTLGLKIAKIIKNNSLKSLQIWNRNKPFSDRVSIHIGDALENNTSLINFICFLDVDELSPVHLVKFLTNANKSNLKNFGYLKLTKKLLITITEYLNSQSKLNKINFYYEPLKQVNLLYTKEIDDDVMNNFSNKIEIDSNLTDVEIIPLQEKYETDINEALTNDIQTLLKTLKFSCKIVENNKKSIIYTDKVFEKQNKIIDSVLEKIDRKEGFEQKNSIVSVRTYINRAIGESLNQALYDLEIQRERFPEKKELFSEKGSIRYVAQYLLNNKS